VSTAELIKQQLEREAFNAQDKVAELKKQLAGETDPGRQRALSLKLESAAQDEARLLQALFATPRTL
jgi:hypothetical protein